MPIPVGQKRKESEGVGIVEKQNTNSDTVKVSFEVSCDDWYLIKQSETWNHLQNFLEMSENRIGHTPLTEKVALLEGQI